MTLQLVTFLTILTAQDMLEIAVEAVAEEIQSIRARWEQGFVCSDENCSRERPAETKRTRFQVLWNATTHAATHQHCNVTLMCDVIPFAS